MFRTKFKNSDWKFFLRLIGCSIYFFVMAMINVSIAQNENLVPNIKKKIVKATDGEKTINRTEAKYKRIFVMENMAPLPFKELPFKPIYKGEITPEFYEESQKIKESAINQQFTFFEIKKQKKIDRKKNEREMLAFNEERNKKFFEYFKRAQKIRSQPANLNGFRHDYTKYLENFLITSKR